MGSVLRDGAFLFLIRRHDPVITMPREKVLKRGGIGNQSEETFPETACFNILWSNSSV